jgi:tetratricopeptide (TPR) repeat protein
MSGSRNRGGPRRPQAAPNLPRVPPTPTWSGSELPAVAALRQGLSFRRPNLPGLSGATGPNRAALTQIAEARRSAAEGARLIGQGAADKAIPLLERAIAIDPGVAAWRHDLGIALLAVGRLEQAGESFAAAVRVDGALPSAHHNQAYVLDALGREEEALLSYEAAARLKPDLIAAQSRLGDLYLARGRRADAEAAFRAVAEATAGTLAAQVAEARGLEAAGEPDAAMACLRQIVEANPDCAEARLALGRLLAQAGQSDAASEHLEQAARIEPSFGAAWYGVATNRKFTPGDASAIAQINGALGRRDLTPSHRQALHFALGKAHDDIGEYETAIRHIDAANRIRAASSRLNRQALLGRVEQLIAATPRGFLDNLPHPGVDDPTPILIVGMPRSGTTLVEQILSSHPQVGAGGEQQFWGMQDKPREEFWAVTETPEAIRKIADDCLAMLRGIDPGAARVTDKMPFNFALLGLVSRVFPRATLVHCRRDPVDTCLSIYSTNFEVTFDFAGDQGDLVFYYRQYQRLMDHWREVLPTDRFVEVEYEALVSDPEPHARRLVAACGLEWDEACLAPHRNTRRIATASLFQARQPIYRTSVQRWRRYEPWLGELLELSRPS